MNTVRLCDGGYTDTLNHDARPSLPPNCQNDKINLTTISHGSQRGNGIFKTNINRAIFDNGCNNAYIVVGFDAPVFFGKKKGINKGNGNSMVSKITRLNNHLRACDNLLGADCSGFYHRIDFNSNSAQSDGQLELEINFSGSESAIPVPNFQFTCNLSDNCGKLSSIPQIPHPPSLSSEPPKREILNDVGLITSASQNQNNPSSSLEYEAWHSAVIHIMINDIAVTNADNKAYQGASNSAEMIDYGCTCRTLLPFEARFQSHKFDYFI